jgi:hypothetical protein
MCSIEAEIGTEETPHPIPKRFHTCASVKKDPQEEGKGGQIVGDSHSPRLPISCLHELERMLHD